MTDAPTDDYVANTVSVQFEVQSAPGYGLFSASIQFTSIPSYGISEGLNDNILGMVAAVKDFLDVAYPGNYSNDAVITYGGDLNVPV